MRLDCINSLSLLLYLLRITLSASLFWSYILNIIDFSLWPVGLLKLSGLRFSYIRTNCMDCMNLRRKE